MSNQLMRATMLALCAVTMMLVLRGQNILNGSNPGEGPILFNGDTVVLEAGEPRKDLECSVIPLRAVLGFDMKFHTGYDVSIPLRELEGTGNTLSILFRVVAKGKDAPVYFAQQFHVPRVTDPAGQVTLEGNFDLGEGSYHVDWLMRDFAGRFCSTSWSVDAALTWKDRQISLALPPQAVRNTQSEEFEPEPPVRRADQNPPLNVKLLINFAPQRAESAALDALDTVALVSILRNISRNPEIGKFSLTVFNIQEQRVLFKEASVDEIDFPALGEALKNLNLGTVRASQLGQKKGDVTFLSSLVKDETSSGPNPDALVFVSPKTLIDASIPQDELRQLGDLSYPLFYMNYDVDPQATPWRDAIGRMVKFFKGREYTITGPRDLWSAVSEMVSKIAKSKQDRDAAAKPSPQQR
jgi:hypothetical protein